MRKACARSRAKTYIKCKAAPASRVMQPEKVKKSGMVVGREVGQHNNVFTRDNNEH